MSLKYPRTNFNDIDLIVNLTNHSPGKGITTYSKQQNENSYKEGKIPKILAMKSLHVFLYAQLTDDDLQNVLRKNMTIS